METFGEASRAMLLVGTAEPVPGTRRLTAGPLTVELTEGALRAVRWHGAEVLRSVAYVIRDRDWGTLAPELTDLAVAEDDAGFRVRYRAACAGPGGTRLRYAASIEGHADGRLAFAVEAVPEGDFETNRCGFCVLHPILGVAGEPARIEHVDGTVRDARFPDAIEPWQPFQDLRAITHTVAPGITATCRLEGDTFEMEDQRAWSDASFKTYVRPLARPWPYSLPAGVPDRQSVTLAIAGAGAAPPLLRSADDAVAVTLGPPRGTLPAFGLVVTPEEVAATLRQAERLREVGPQSLLLHLDPVAGHGEAECRALAAVRNLLPGAEAVLECVVPGRGEVGDELARIAAAVRRAGLALDAVAVSPSVDRQSTPPGSTWPDCPPLDAVYAAARAAFPGLRLGGGMFSYFTELNRKRPPVALLDFVTHCTCPIVHAADDRSVMQSLEALPAIVRSARRIVGAMPYRIGPSTIGMRQNPYGSRTFDNPGGGRLTMTHADPRQRGLFAAAWTVGYVAGCAEGHLEAFTGGALTGAFGLIPADAAGRVHPLFYVARGLAALAGAPRLACQTSHPDRLLGFAARTDARTVLWLANITPHAQAATLPEGAWRAAVLDGDAWPDAERGRMPPAGEAPRRLTLEPYAVAQLEA